MQSYSDVPRNVAKRFTVAEGKENSSKECPQQSRKLLQKSTPKGPQKSRLPVPSKIREPPDFHKLHETWQSNFLKGKAVSKKSCTRPQPFNFSHKGERLQAKTTTNAGISATSTNLGMPQTATLKAREPLAEVVFGQQNKEPTVGKDGPEVEFKADPAALASILSNVGVPIGPGKISLAQRVPVRSSSIVPQHNTNKNLMVRSSMYTMPSKGSVHANLDRMSCIPSMTVKASDQKSMFRHQLFKLPVSAASLKEATDSKQEEKCHPQENPLLQQMNKPLGVPSSKEESTVQPNSANPVPDHESSTVPSAPCEKCPAKMDNAVVNSSAKQSDADSADFVADSQALASILSNTEINIANCGKPSLAQRVPIQGRCSVLKGAMVLPGSSVLRSTPKSASGPKSNANVPTKGLVSTPCRIPNTVLSSDNGSGGSARRVKQCLTPCRIPNSVLSSDNGSGGSTRRVLQPKSSSVKFSQPFSLRLKQPVFPKTPRALALEKANQRHFSEGTENPSASMPAVRWKDDLSPSPTSEVLCENEPDMEQIAVRLFLDGECPEGSSKNKDVTATPQQGDRTPVEKCVSDGSGSGPPPSSCLHPVPSQQSSNDSLCSIASSVPLSFLTHPAVKALQSSSSGPCSLPDLTRLRLQAAVSAKQRFWDARLDEECAFYTSQGATGSNRFCRDPVTSYLDRQEDMHFTPICPGESSEELSITNCSPPVSLESHQFATTQ